MGGRVEAVAANGTAIRYPVLEIHRPYGGFGAPIPHRVVPPPQVPTIRSEAVEVAATVK